MEPRRSRYDDAFSCVLRCSHPVSPFVRLTDHRAREYGRRALLSVDDVIGQCRLRQLIDHDHLDGIVLRHVVAHPYALCAALAPIHGHIGRAVFKPFILPQLVAVEDGVGFRAILCAELAALGGTNFYTNISYEIHANSFRGTIRLWPWQPARRPA